MVLRNILLLASGLVSLLAEIWRTRKVRTRRVIFIKDLRDHLAADDVPVRVHAELRQHPEEGVVILVVAGPDCDARMAAEFQHHLGNLVPDLRSEFFALRVYDAGHREVLPDHYALPVAPVVERLVFIDIAAPAAYHIAVEVHHHIDGAVHPFPVAAVEAVERHPVRSAREYLLAVDIEAEPSGGVPVDVGHLQAHRPESHLPGVLGEHFAAVIQKGNGAVIQGRVTVSLRPPELCPFDGELGPPGEGWK